MGDTELSSGDAVAKGSNAATSISRFETPERTALPTK